MESQVFIEISKYVFLIAGFWALIQFWSANEFKKAQYLSELWGKFYTTDVFVKIFDILDKNNDEITELENIDSKDIFSYLAFLEEIVIFRKKSFFETYKIADKNLIPLFQYHFFNIYIKNDKKTKLFWNKIEDPFSNNPSWKSQFDFAKKCAENINKQ